jgi:hypothetical protein
MQRTARLGRHGRCRCSLVEARASPVLQVPLLPETVVVVLPTSVDLVRHAAVVVPAVAVVLRTVEHDDGLALTTMGKRVRDTMRVMTLKKVMC